MYYLDEYFTESYFGKTKNLQMAERILGQMLEIMREMPHGDFSNHPLNKELEKTFQKQFGFKRVYIIWDRSPLTSFTAFTLCSSDVLFDPKYFLVKNKEKGFYDESHRHIAYIRVSVEIPLQLNFTPGELLGTILHEFGHNFDDSLYTRIGIGAAYLGNIIGIINGIMMDSPELIGQYAGQFAGALLSTTNTGHLINAKLNHLCNKFLNHVPALKKMRLVLNKVCDIVSAGLDVLDSTLGFITLPLNLLLSPVAQLGTLLTRKGEEFADSFAGAYGYGPDVISGLAKMSGVPWMKNNRQNMDYENPVYKIATDICMFQHEIIAFANGDHGTDSTRAVGIKQELIRDLKSANYPPALKKDLLNSIKALDDIHKEIIECHGNDSNFVLTAFARQSLDTIFNGRSDFIAKLFPANTVRTAMGESTNDIELDFEGILY